MNNLHNDFFSQYLNEPILREDFLDIPPRRESIPPAYDEFNFLEESESKQLSDGPELFSDDSASFSAMGINPHPEALPQPMENQVSKSKNKRGCPHSSRRKKKGRPRKYNMETSFEREQLRLEKNRMSARESRKRRKEHFKELEVEVLRLREELRKSREVVAKYEIIEKIKNRNPLEMLKKYEEEETKIKVLMSSFKEKDGLDLSKLYVQCMDDAMERRRVLDYISNTFVQLLLPPHIKYLLYAAQNNCGIFSREMRKKEVEMKNTQNMAENINMQLNTHVSEIQASEMEFIKATESQAFFKNSSAKFKALSSQYIDVKSQLLQELESVQHYIVHNLMPKLSVPSLHSFLESLDKIKSQESLQYTDSYFFGIKKLDSESYKSELDPRSSSPPTDTLEEILNPKKRPKIFKSHQCQDK